MITLPPEMLIGLLVVLFLFTVISVRMRRLRKALNARDEKLDPGYIYFISDIGQIVPIVKIGYALDAPKRLNTHRTSAPLGIFVWCIIRVDDMNSAENALHKVYGWMRVRKTREFFFVMPGLLFDMILLRLMRHVPENDARQVIFVARTRLTGT